MDEELKEFESAANRAAIAREHEMEKAREGWLKETEKVKELEKQYRRDMEAVYKACAHSPLSSEPVHEAICKIVAERDRLRKALEEMQEQFKCAKYHVHSPAVAKHLDEGLEIATKALKGQP